MKKQKQNLKLSDHKASLRQEKLSFLCDMPYNDTGHRREHKSAFVEDVREINPSKKKIYIFKFEEERMQYAIELYFDKEAERNLTNLILHEFKKMSGKFVSIGLAKISFPVEEIYTAELGY